MDGYTKAPSLAWSGWRLRVPGGPYGGQYHGYIASDDVVDGVGWPAGREEIFRPADSTAGLGSLPTDPWDPNWGGIALQEGDTLSDHVYRSPAELRPRPNASGGVNVVRGFQRERSAGFAVAPGNYRGLGYQTYIAPEVYRPGVLPVRIANPPIIVARPAPRPILFNPPGESGATSAVPQPPPASPAPVHVVADPMACASGQYRDAAGNCTSDWHNPYVLYLPQSPRPAPTVQASPEDFLPSQGQAVPGITPGAAGGASSGLTDWLASQSLITGFPNWGVVLAGVLAAKVLLGGRR